MATTAESEWEMVAPPHSKKKKNRSPKLIWHVVFKREVLVVVYVSICTSLQMVCIQLGREKKIVINK